MSDDHTQRIADVYPNLKRMAADYQSAFHAMAEAFEPDTAMKDPTYCSMSFLADLHAVRSRDVNPEDYADNIPVCETCEGFYPCLKVQADAHKTADLMVYRLADIGSLGDKADEMKDLFSSLSAAPGVIFLTLEQLPYALGFVDGSSGRISKEDRVALALKSVIPSPELGVAFLCAMDVIYYIHHSGLYESGERLEKEYANEAFIEGMGTATAALFARQQSGLDRLPERNVFERYNRDKRNWTMDFIAEHFF